MHHVRADAGEQNSTCYMIRFPGNREHMPQNEEMCEIQIDGNWQQLRLHDYDRIYRMPGLYEQLFADRLQCTSPQRVVSVFSDVLGDWPVKPSTLRALELGAGNGMVGEELRQLGVEALLGVDILPEAAEAAHRDRPGVYDDYLVADFTNLSPRLRKKVTDFRANCLVTVAALGFGDIPPSAFMTAYNLVSTPGWVVFNIKENFLSGVDDTGFARLIRAMSEQEYIQIQAYRRYSHRLSVSGQRLHYVAIVARKLRAVPESLLKESS